MRLLNYWTGMTVQIFTPNFIEYIYNKYRLLSKIVQYYQSFNRIRSKNWLHTYQQFLKLNANAQENVEF